MEVYIIIILLKLFLLIIKRTKFRKQMNTVDNEAAGKALDSLLNFETVKVKINSLKYFFF